MYKPNMPQKEIRQTYSSEVNNAQDVLDLIEKLKLSPKDIKIRTQRNYDDYTTIAEWTVTLQNNQYEHDMDVYRQQMQQYKEQLMAEVMKIDKEII